MSARCPVYSKADAAGRFMSIRPGSHRERSLSTNWDNSSMICNSLIALRGNFMDNLRAALDAPTALNVTVAMTRRRKVRRSSRPREYLTEREIEKLMDAASGNRWDRDATAILI